MTVRTCYEHIVVGEDGVPTIAGTTTKVVELVAEKLAYGWSPEEIHLQHPYLSMGQVHAALAYYWDHAEELDKDMGDRLRRVEGIRKALGPSPLVRRLKEKGLI